MGKKYYAVRFGRRPGIYKTWNQAEEQIKGFSGSKFKSFKTLELAKNYMCSALEDNTVIDDVEEVNKNIEEEIEALGEEQVIAFVDGSYSPDADGKEKYGFGAILITKESKTNLYKAFVNNEYMESRNVAGEIEGVKQSILWSIQNNKNEITVYYDYEGIEKWANKEWKAKKKLTREYSKFIDENKKIINIKFIHVKAHSGVVYNERADELAKRALLSQGYKAYNDGSIYFIGFNISDWIDIIKDVSKENEDLENGIKIKFKQTKPRDYLERMELRSESDKLTINCYKGNKTYVQGKQCVLFQKVISYAIEKLPNKNTVIETLNRYHVLNIEEIEVINQSKMLLPNLPIEMADKKHCNNLFSAVFNTMLVGYMPDYTCLITPVFRALEYYLHRIIHDEFGKNTIKANGSNNFAYFSRDKTTGEYTYNSNTDGFNEEKIGYLNELYNFYNRIRHPYSHWSQESIDTQVITEMDVARELLLEGLKLINKYYTIFKHLTFS